MLEKSVESKQKAVEYVSQIKEVNSEIGKLEKEVAFADPGNQPFGHSLSAKNEVLRLQRGNKELKDQLESLRKELGSKVYLKQEIDDWFSEKVSLEFQIERESFRAQTIQDELDANQKTFDKEIETLRDMLKRKTEQLDQMVGPDRSAAVV